MKANLLKTVFVFLIAVSGFTASAQDLSPVRHYFGVNYSIVSENLRDIPISTNFISSSIISPNQEWINNFGINYEFILTQDSAKRICNSSITSRLNYYSFNFETNYNFGGGYSNPEQTEQFNYYGYLQASYSVINLSVAWKKRFFKTPVYLSFGPNITFMPSSEAYQDITIAPEYIERGRRFLPEEKVEISDNGTRAEIRYDKIGDSRWELGIQTGVSVEFAVQNFIYNLHDKSASTNSIVVAPYAMIYIPGKALKEMLIKPKYWEENVQPWRRSPLQAGLDIRMPMPF